MKGIETIKAENAPKRKPVTKAELEAGREKFDQAIERRARLDLWVGQGLAGMISGGWRPNDVQKMASDLHDYAEALEAERTRRLGR